MAYTEILIAGQPETTPAIMTAGTGNDPGWRISVAADDEAAIEAFHQREPDVVLFTGGLSETAVKKLQRIFTLQNENVLLIHDPGAALRQQVIADALSKRAAKVSYTFTDDAFKNSVLNIEITH